MGWPVFPLLPRSKVPPKGSHGVKDATIDADLVEAWWRRATGQHRPSRRRLVLGSGH